jgi:hypothetical protein
VDNADETTFCGTLPGTPLNLLSQAPDGPFAGKAGCGAALGKSFRDNHRLSEKRTLSHLPG